MSGRFSSLCLSVVRSDVCVWTSVVVVGCSIPKNCAPVCENVDIHTHSVFPSTWKTSKCLHERFVRYFARCSESFELIERNILRRVERQEASCSRGGNSRGCLPSSGLSTRYFPRCLIPVAFSRWFIRFIPEVQKRCRKRGRADNGLVSRLRCSAKLTCPWSVVVAKERFSTLPPLSLSLLSRVRNTPS